MNAAIIFPSDQISCNTGTRHFMCRILLVFELYTQDRPDRGLPLRFLFSFGEERASKGGFSLISGRGFKKFERALCARYLLLKLTKA